VLRQTIRQRLQAKLGEVKAELKRRIHQPIPELGKWLGGVVGGHMRYYRVPMNMPALFLFRSQVGWLWHRALSRRSENGRVDWDRMRRLIDRWLPLCTSIIRILCAALALVLEARVGCGNPVVRIRGGGHGQP
jgi:RNA-directed DNA polymerase